MLKIARDCSFVPAKSPALSYRTYAVAGTLLSNVHAQDARVRHFLAVRCICPLSHRARDEQQAIGQGRTLYSLTPREAPRMAPPRGRRIRADKR